MSNATVPSAGLLAADPILVNAIAGAVESCLAMCDTAARCAGISTIPAGEPGNITGIIGVHGDVSGFVTVNLTEQAAMTAVGGLLQERFDRLTPQVIDGAGEMTNLIAGGVKKGLAGSPWSFSQVTVPSVIVGRNYQIAYTRGLEYVNVTFELQSEDVLLLADRLLQVAISLIRL